MALNLFLVETIAAVNTPQPKASNLLNLQVETHFRHEPFMYKRRMHRLEGNADYSLWYGSNEDFSCNLVVVEAKTTKILSSGKGQTLSYMGKRSPLIIN